MPSLTSQTLTDLFATTSPSALLLLVTVTHASLPEPFRVVNNTEPIISRGQTFLPFAFEFTLPDDTRERPSEMDFILDAVALPLIDPLRAMVTPASMLVELVSSARPDVVEMDVTDLTVRGVEWSRSRITLTCAHEDTLHARFPADDYTPARYPGIA